jgi:hypothetical protein
VRRSSRVMVPSGGGLGAARAQARARVKQSTIWGQAGGKPGASTGETWRSCAQLLSRGRAFREEHRFTEKRFEQVRGVSISSAFCLLIPQILGYFFHLAFR